MLHDKVIGNLAQQAELNPNIYLKRAANAAADPDNIKDMGLPQDNSLLDDVSSVDDSDSGGYYSFESESEDSDSDSEYFDVPQSDPTLVSAGASSNKSLFNTGISMVSGAVRYIAQGAISSVTTGASYINKAANFLGIT